MCPNAFSGFRTVMFWTRLFMFSFRIIREQVFNIVLLSDHPLTSVTIFCAKFRIKKIYICDVFRQVIIFLLSLCNKSFQTTGLFLLDPSPVLNSLAYNFLYALYKTSKSMQIMWNSRTKFQFVSYSANRKWKLKNPQNTVLVEHRQRGREFDLIEKMAWLQCGLFVKVKKAYILKITIRSTL